MQIFSVRSLIYCPVKRFYVSVASQDAGSDASSPWRMQTGETLGAAVTLEPLNQLKTGRQMTEWAWVEWEELLLANEWVSSSPLYYLMANGSWVYLHNLCPPLQVSWEENTAFPCPTTSWCPASLFLCGFVWTPSLCHKGPDWTASPAWC